MRVYKLLKKEYAKKGTDLRVWFARADKETEGKEFKIMDALDFFDKTGAKVVDYWYDSDIDEDCLCVLYE